VKSSSRVSFAYSARGTGREQVDRTQKRAIPTRKTKGTGKVKRSRLSLGRQFRQNSSKGKYFIVSVFDCVISLQSATKI